MKTFVILSDSHGKKSAVGRLSGLFAENDFIVHLGDGYTDMRDVSKLYPQKTYLVKGNCDASAAPEECVIEAEGVSVLCCHGHRYGVKGSLDRLCARAKELGCIVALYGHTHRARIDELDGVLLVNPGAAGAYVDPTYCYLVVHGKKATAAIVPLP